MTRAPVISISHGGGPMPVLGDPSHKAIVQSLQTKVPKLLRLNTPDAPRAIILVTAHWSERNPTISSEKKHKLYYDYGGFPPEAYKLKYDAPGSPEVAKEVADALRSQGFTPDMDDERGWDHGVFIPMMLIHPSATVPIVQLSVLDSESPADHYRMGQALSKLRDSNVAIIGSGFATFHNLRLMFSGAAHNPDFRGRNKEWSDAVSDGVLEPDVEARKTKLEDWRKWPNSYEMHPRHGSEHFLPLIVCAGAAGEGKGGSYTDEFMGMEYYSFYWE
ncbi:extradiol ring-cleavage dioxygenase [Pseudovirgaria hyperparasitica]|uniref:Extradiol ring-cleavage dioxygenase n=1 Tax=Pseudovirgaria hyperparasitica TaxID=470096 RepID=A0A6A6W5X5_9PEZI|nr:extradiol ring-cleavage dioxygenase [Pseudovirgaria hyperparasitica]KAF2756947.1 extradiol ring-cleavage dioxygenase [Pseudovirgaria hyperparasitica]